MNSTYKKQQKGCYSNFHHGAATSTNAAPCSTKSINFKIKIIDRVGLD